MAPRSSVVRVLGHDLHREVDGDGPALLLLHGGHCSLDHLRPLAAALAGHRTVHAYERPGHGRSPDTHGPYHYGTGTAEALAYLDAEGLGAVDVVGFSDGAIIGLLLACQHPDRVRSLVAISGNLSPDGFADDGSQDGSQNDDGPADDPVLAKLRHLWRTEPAIDPGDLAAVTARVLVLAGQDDVVRPDHSRLIAASVPRGEVRLLDGATHALVTEREREVVELVTAFVTAPAPTPAPTPVETVRGGSIIGA